jgi:hypothetical protein
MWKQIADFRYYGYLTWLLFILVPLVAVVPWLCGLFLSASLLSSLLAMWRNRGLQKFLGVVGFFVVGFVSSEFFYVVFHRGAQHI